MAISGRRLDDSTRRWIHRRLGDGASRREIAREAGVCKRTVDKEAGLDAQCVAGDNSGGNEQPQTGEFLC